MPEQRQQIVLRLTDHLKLIASRISIEKLEWIQSNARTKQMGPEMKQMGYPCAVSEFDGIESDVLDLIQTIRLATSALKHRLQTCW